MTDWFESLPAELTVDHGGQKVALKDMPFVKESPDLGHFVNKTFAQHRELGSRIPVKKIEKPEDATAWRKDNLPKLYDAGVLERPPVTPEAYEIKKPDTIPEGLAWSDERAAKLAGVLHKHGIPKSAVNDLLELHAEALTGAQVALKTDYDSGIAALKTEFGNDYDRLTEQSKRLTAAIFKTAPELEFFESTGFGNHPLFLSVMMRLSKFAEQDSSIIPNMGRGDGGARTGDEVKAELAAIMSDPNHPKHKLYWQRDAATLQYIDDLYKKVYPGQMVIS
jgi:hypothetical protein